MSEPKFNADGLVPAVVQDAGSGTVLMLGYMNADALEKTRQSGKVWFWSRSRQSLWMKGETSGNTLQVRELRVDCDGDAVLVLANPAGPTCHTNEVSCFHRSLDTDMVLPEPKPVGAHTLDELFAVVQSRKETMPEGSYTTKLLRGGVDRIGKKVGEEATEVVIAAKNADPAELAWELADLYYHTLVLMASVGIEPEDVWKVLRSRRG